VIQAHFLNSFAIHLNVSLLEGNTMDEDLFEVFQLMAEDDRRRRYLKEIGSWLIEEEFELHQAS
jgi:hypothetical protein